MASAPRKRRLVAATAARLRERILAAPPGTRLGGLSELAAELGVGQVTLQQAARILEHEGLLRVRRGPGGGYYGARPDEEALERALSAWLAVHRAGHRETFAAALALDAELFEAAAKASRPEVAETAERLLARLEECHTPQALLAFEVELREALFAQVDRPLLRLLSHVAWRFHEAAGGPVEALPPEQLAAWRRGRRRILGAIAAGDAELAVFEAGRYRRLVMGWLEEGEAPAGGEGAPAPGASPRRPEADGPGSHLPDRSPD
ncbi:MAG: hypothetical protein KatS3mg124_0154 [Porticoccaceae bacterium]|nr:MAG: hypothetical protein KatS3mg124_0154 [Porticoccaceae bacterium]